MKEVVTMVKGYIDDLAHLLMSFVAIGAISEVIFGSGIFGVNVIGNLTSIINKFGESGFAGLVALLVLVGLFRKQERNSSVFLQLIQSKKRGKCKSFPFFVYVSLRLDSNQRPEHYKCPALPTELLRLLTTFICNLIQQPVGESNSCCRNENPES